MDSLLVVCCYESIDKNVFYTYDKDTGELLKTFGTIGNGPGEMMDLMTIYADREKYELYHNSFNVPKYVKFNVDSFINGNNGITYYKIRENKIPAFLHRYSDEHIDEKNHPGITSYVCTTDDYIFCGWSQNVKKENRPNDILVFDWKGIAKGLIDIENVEIFNWVMEYDIKEQKMYIVVENNQGVQNIVRYDMSHLQL